MKQRPAFNFPLERWASRNPHVRWPLVLLAVFALTWLGSLNPPDPVQAPAQTNGGNRE